MLRKSKWHGIKSRRGSATLERIYVLDLSGSTQDPVTTTACGTQNPTKDGVSNTVLDGELGGALALNAAAIHAGTVAEVAAIGFAGNLTPVTANARSYDLSPASGLNTFVAPNAGSGTPYLQTALQSSFVAAFSGGSNDGLSLFTPEVVGTGTNFWAAIHELRSVVATSSASNKLAVFLSDGTANQTGTGTTFTQELALLAATGIKVDTFAVGPGAGCTTTPNVNGALFQISNTTGGTCTPLDDPAAITAVPGVISSQLTSVQLSLDSGPSARPGR